MVVRRSAAAEEGSRGRWEPRESGSRRGVDLKEVFLEEEGEGAVVDSERCVRDEAWVGTLSLLGCGGDSKD